MHKMNNLKQQKKKLMEIKLENNSDYLCGPYMKQPPHYEPRAVPNRIIYTVCCT